MVRPLRGASPRVEAARALQSLRIARVRLARLVRRLESVASRDRSVRGMLELLYKLDYLIELASLKLEVYVATGLATYETLEAALAALRLASDWSREAPPELASLVLDAEESAMRVAGALGVPAPPNPAGGQPEPVSEDLKEIIEEASRVARSRLESLPG